MQVTTDNGPTGTVTGPAVCERTIAIAALIASYRTSYAKHAATSDGSPESITLLDAFTTAIGRACYRYDYYNHAMPD